MWHRLPGRDSTAGVREDGQYRSAFHSLGEPKDVKHFIDAVQSVASDGFVGKMPGDLSGPQNATGA